MKVVLQLICLVFFQTFYGQVTCIIDSLPNNHNYNQNVFVSGDFEGWSGGKEEFKLLKSNGKYHITIPKLKETISFKFTLGSWDFSECDGNGNPITNRVYTFGNTSDTIYVKIAKWTDSTSKIKRSTALKNVHVFSEEFKIPQLNRTRRISVYLPPNYESSSENYPVLYMHDGQNVFDLATSYAGEWEVDETLDRLYKERGLGIIVVAINHGGETRLNEYSPWFNPKYGVAEGDAYLKFIINTLKPEIDKSFRTKKDSNNTAIMGSSMGGLISHYAGLKYSKVFGKVGVFSPSFWYSEDAFLFTETKSKLKHGKMYYLVGGKEGEGMVENVEKMVNIMKLNKFSKNNIRTKVVLNGTHSESFWKTEFESAVLWLFH
ncbi:alpha/beta hydrolase [Mariniflexile sp.]|uniref:alpha/beta hydrolase n=1 Tax=Mariniflexile sp. TaxID=1979402 RepID=UPI0035689049